MASLTNGDLTESFFHLSLDHSDRLSSGDDVSVHTLDDMLTFLRLAKAHDMNARLRDGSRDFRGENTFRARELASKRPSFDDFTQNSVDFYRKFALDPVLATRPSQSTPAAHKRGFTRKNGHESRPKSDSEDNLEQNSTLEENQDNYNTASPHETKVKGNTQNIDVESLFRAFQPLLDQYIRTHIPVEKALSPGEIGQNGPESDPDSAVDDTFDRPKRSGIRTARPELSSPVTSPPQSSGDSQFCFDKSTEVESDVCQQILPETQARKLIARSKHEKVTSSAPQIEMGDLTSDEIDMNMFLQKSTESASETAERETLESLNFKLDQYRKDNEGMLSEIRYLRCKLDALTKNAASKGLETLQGDNKGETAAEVPNQETSNVAHGDAFETNLPEQFRPYYLRLQLHKVDELGGAEKSNLIKNLMLLLLVSDFDHISVMAPKVGTYLRVTTAFLDSLHERLYPDVEMKPLQYLRNHRIDINDGLQQCLDGMTELIFEP